MDITPIVARLSVIADSVNALRALQPLAYEEFAREHILIGSAERDFQVAIQAALDAGAYLLAQLSASVPTDYKEIFLRLAEMGVLPGDLANRLVGMAKFRNVLVHMYLEVDLKKVYHYLQNDLGDLESFARHVSQHILRLSTG